MGVVTTTRSGLALAAVLASLPFLGCQLILPKYEKPLPVFDVKNELDATLEDSDHLVTNLETRILPERSLAIFSSRFPKHTEVADIINYFESIGGSCVPIQEEDSAYSCRYCTVKFDQIFEQGWKLRRMEVLWTLKASAEAGQGYKRLSNRVSIEEQEIVQLSFSLIISGDGVLPNSLEDPDLSSCGGAMQIEKKQNRKQPYLGVPLTQHVVY